MTARAVTTAVTLALLAACVFLAELVSAQPRPVAGPLASRPSSAPGGPVCVAVLETDVQTDLPAEDRHRITLWLDCNSEFFGAYENTQAQARLTSPRGSVRLPAR